MTTLTLASNVNNAVSGAAPFDIYLNEEGNIATSYDIQAILQACAQAASTILGEMIYNTDQGIPFKEAVWVGTPNLTQYTASLRNAFLSVNGGGIVTEVLSLLTSQQGSILYYTAKINTIYGTTTLSGSTE